MTQWRKIGKPDTNMHFYCKLHKGYHIEIHDVNGGIEIGVYLLDKEPEIQKPPLRLEIPFHELENQERFQQVLECINDLIHSITQDNNVANKRTNQRSKKETKVSN
jgi:hypothetical protein